ncbi:hypothetical protein BUL40_08290 [Croceivirga radicis]|uniref:Glycosyltransferase family 4 protein n=1 Tax=Croceivirga radicis TaxID=1929488 RepID=A0A1V6LSF2_9FLAO|nr:glycosyltransferase family 4 protein [Croceivirga radicis]OQD43078.1 hypothetical protein BUL40_08290 [Croceivirga radicis]
MKKICFVIHSITSGGAERVLVTLANNLSQNYDVSIVILEKNKPFYRINPKIKIIHCLDYIPPSKGIKNALQLNIKLISKLRKIIKNGKFNIVISFLTNTNILINIATLGISSKTIISERNNPYKNCTVKYWRVLRRITYPWANHLVVQTNFVKNYFLPYVDAKKISILPNPLSKHIKLPTNLSKENIILNVGRLSEQKGQEILIQAFAKLALDDWKLILIGEGPKRTEYENLIKELGLTQKIKLLGKQMDISRHYNRAKIFAFPSRYEGFPNALIEAMYLKLAVISSDCDSGPNEIIINNKNGYLFKVDNVDELAQKINTLVNNQEKIELMGNEAHETAKQFEVETVIEKWKTLIENNLE